MTEDYGDKLDAFLYADASAAIGVANREGLGRIRHLDTQSLWLQQALRRKRLGLGKVLGTENPSDLMTKHVDAKTLEHHVQIMGCVIASGRPELAPQVVQGVDDAGAVDFGPATAQGIPLRKIRDGSTGRLFASLKSLGRGCKGHDFAGTGECVVGAQGKCGRSNAGYKSCRPRSRGKSGNMSRFGMAASTRMHTSPAFLALETYRSRGGAYLTLSRSDATPCIGHARICHEQQSDCSSLFSLSRFPLDAFWAQDR